MRDCKICLRIDETEVEAVQRQVMFVMISRCIHEGIDNGTYIARYDDLFNGKEEQIDVSKVDVSMNGIELINREFVAAILEKREPNGSLWQCLPAMQVMHEIEKNMTE